MKYAILNMDIHSYSLDFSLKKGDLILVKPSLSGCIVYSSTKRFCGYYSADFTPYTLIKKSKLLGLII